MFGKKNNRRLQPKKLVFVATATVSVLLFGRIQGEIKDSLRRKKRKFGNSEQRGLTLRFHDIKISPTFVLPLTGSWKDALLNSHKKHKITYFFGNKGF